MRKFASWGLVFVSCVALSAGCATANSVRNARASLEKAKGAGAETKAPADYYLAEAYFHKAEHETKEGDGKQARHFADQSERYSSQALQKARGGAK